MIGVIVVTHGQLANELVNAARTIVGELPQFVAEGKSYLTIAIGCTGGRHRSVMVAEALRKTLRGATGTRVRVHHRDITHE